MAHRFCHDPAGSNSAPLTRRAAGEIVTAPPVSEEREHPKLGLALSGGGHRAAFFHIGVLAKLAELGLLRPVQVISTVSGGSIIGALYYLHVKNLLESKADAEIADADYVELVRAVEHEYREAAASNVRGSGWANLLENFKMAKPTYSRTDRVGAALRAALLREGLGRTGRKRNGRIAMRDLLIEPKGHAGAVRPRRREPAAERARPDPAARGDDAQHRPQLALRGDVRRRAAAAGNGRPGRPRGRGQERDPRADALGSAPRGLPELPARRGGRLLGLLPGGFPPVVVPKIFDDLTIELVDGGVHDNQGVEGLVDRGCTHRIISDGSGQMPDLPRPSTRLPAVLGRVISIYGDAEREQRLLAAPAARATRPASCTCRPACPRAQRTPGGQVSEKEAKIESTDFGVLEDVQRALAQVRTDLDSFCEVEAWALMADAYQLTDRIVPTRAGLAALGTPGADVEWPFEVVAEQLAQPSKKFLKLLHSSKERFFKPARMLPPLLPVTLLLLLAALGAAVYGLWLLADAARDGALHRRARHARRAGDLRELREQVRQAGRDRDLRRRPPRPARDPARAGLVAAAGRRPLVALARPRQAVVALTSPERGTPDGRLRPIPEGWPGASPLRSVFSSQPRS